MVLIVEFLFRLVFFYVTEVAGIRSERAVTAVFELAMDHIAPETNREVKSGAFPQATILFH